MVALELVRASNAKVSSLAPGLVAVFIGGTSGIGETALKAFAKYAREPRIYFVGREQATADRILSELKALNAKGQYIFMKADVSLIKVVDDVCKELKSKETTINLLFLTPGNMISGTETSEGMHLTSVLVYYTRTRFILNLLPLIEAAPHLRRVVTVFAATKEGPVDTSDFQARKLGITVVRGHMSSLVTLSLETLAEKAPTVSFVHVYPGFVKTGIARGTKGLGFALMKAVFLVIGPVLFTPNEEVGERMLFLATSGVYCRVDGDRVLEGGGVPSSNIIMIADGTSGKRGTGVYSVDETGESAGQKVVELMVEFRKEGTGKKLWAHTLEEFKRITGNEVA